MQRSVAKILAEQLLITHAGHVQGWSFGGFDRAKKRAGVTKYAEKKFYLSGSYVDLNTPEEVLQTILHEIGHVLAGPGAGHSRTWLLAARRIGYKGGRTIDAAMISVDHLWHGECVACGHVYKYSRKPTPKVVMYGRCNSAKCKRKSSKITWKNTRTGLVLHPTIFI